MTTRNGKIAHLPNDIREQLNLRLLEGEIGRELTAWLNALPAVKSILASQFNGSDISEVNLTHWRQGGYLQWLTERECFDSARALGDGDCDLAKTGLSAERLLNILTLRYGQLLMRWDLPSDEGVSDGPIGGGAGGMSWKEASALSAMAKKARILQGISRSVLAIHRIQSQSFDKKSPPSTTPATSRARSEGYASPRSASVGCMVPQMQEKEASPAGPNPFARPKAADSTRGCVAGQSAIRNPPSLPGEVPFDRLRALSKRSASKRLVVGKGKGRAIPQILSGPIVPPSPPLHLPYTLFKAELDLSEFLTAV
jgi:hypothetical protein